MIIVKVPSIVYYEVCILLKIHKCVENNDSFHFVHQRFNRKLVSFLIDVIGLELIFNQLRTSSKIIWECEKYKNSSELRYIFHLFWYEYQFDWMMIFYLHFSWSSYESIRIQIFYQQFKQRITFVHFLKFWNEKNNRLSISWRNNWADNIFTEMENIFWFCGWKWRTWQHLFDQWTFMCIKIAISSRQFYFTANCHKRYIDIYFNNRS